MRGDRIKQRHLRCALAIAEHGALQKAADHLAVSQPAVSKTIRELEEIVGARLFERGRRGAVPTAAGELFLRHAGMSMSALRSGLESIATKGRGVEVLAVGVLPTVAPALMPNVALGLRTTEPGALLRVVTAANAELLAALRQRKLELVVGRLSEPALMNGLTFEHLYADPLAVVVRAGHPALAKTASGVSFEELARYPAVLAPQGTLIRHNAESLLRKHGAAPSDDCIETLSISFARQLVRASDAVWFVPLGAVKPDLDSGLLARVPVSTAGTEEPIGLVLRVDETPRPAARALIALIREGARRWQ